MSNRNGCVAEGAKRSWLVRRSIGVSEFRYNLRPAGTERRGADPVRNMRRAGEVKGIRAI